MEGTILLALQAIRIPFIIQLFALFSSFCNHGFIWLLLGLLLILFSKNRKKEGFLFIIAVVLCLLIGVLLIGLIVGRERPFDIVVGLTSVIGVEHIGYSFPSFHVATCMAALYIAAKCFGRRPAFFALIFTLIIAFSRMYLGVSYPTDVLAGAFLGFVIGWLCVNVIMRFISQFQIPPAARHSVKNKHNSRNPRR